MRRTLSILIAGLTLGAAPPPDSAVAECRLAHDDAVAALGRLPVLRRATQPSEDAYRHSRQFDPTRLAAFGFPARAANAIQVDAIGHESLAITVTLDAPYASIRSAALASRGKSACAGGDGPPRYCEIDARERDGWTNDFILDEMNGHPTLTCLYTRPSA